MVFWTNCYGQTELNGDPDYLLFGFGDNNDGQIGSGLADYVIYATTRSADDGLDITQIATGGRATVSLLADGSLWGCGETSNGELGSLAATLSYANALVPTQFSAGPWQSIAMGRYCTFAINAAGQLWVTGWNSYGAMGTGASTDLYDFMQVGSYSDWQDVSCFEQHSLAIRGNEIWASGVNSDGQLGDNTTVAKTSFIKNLAPSTMPWLSVSAGGQHSLAVRSDGTLWAWGKQYGGALGTGISSSTDIKIPVQIGTDTDWKKVVCCLGSTFAIKTDNTVYATGTNTNGQLGVGDYTMRTSLALALGGLKVTSVYATLDSTFFISESGSLYGCGVRIWSTGGGDTVVAEEIALECSMLPGSGCSSHVMVLHKP